MPNNNKTEHLEPRVAKLETGLDILTRDVASLAQVVRDQGNSIERQIRDLAVGVTQAAAPRRTDWQTLIAFAMLIMAIGSAVFWPLNQTAQNNKTEIKALEQQYDAHAQLQLHPVGQALLGRVEQQLNDHISVARREQDEQNKAWERQIDLLTERINARLNKLEIIDTERNKADLDELRTLRFKAFMYHMQPCPLTTNGSK